MKSFKILNDKKKLYRCVDKKRGSRKELLCLSLTGLDVFEGHLLLEGISPSSSMYVYLNSMYTYTNVCAYIFYTYSLYMAVCLSQLNCCLSTGSCDSWDLPSDR